MRRRYPKYVSSFVDRHGLERLRFRKTGYKSHYFKAAFGTGAFESEYRQCLGEFPLASSAIQWPDHSVGHLVDLYYQSTGWARLKADSSRQTYSRILDRFTLEYGLRDARTLKAIHLDAIFARMADRPAAAANLRKALGRVWRFAKKFGLVRENILLETDAITQRSRGFYTWTLADLDAFRARWPLGTKERVMFTLALWTAGRRCDLHLMGWHNVDGDWLYFHQIKVDEDHAIPISGELAECLARVPRSQSAFVVKENGQPYSRESYSNMFCDARKAAGLSVGSLHGLRKSMATRLAEAGATDAEGMAILGHRKAETFAHYRGAADRKKLARSGMDKLENG
jgi:integrase